MSSDEVPKIPRWWMGGLSDCCAACVTHPMDLVKTQLQMQQVRPQTARQLVVDVVRRRGVGGLYDGISASWMRLGTYCTARWFIYNKLKEILTTRESPNLSYPLKVVCAAGAGFLGGFVGVPADKVNVRMQNDIRLPVEQRRNYKNVFHGLYKIANTEGFVGLFGGSLMFCSRALVIAVGQFSTYDQVKQLLLASSSSTSSWRPHFTDSLTTHLICSFAAGSVATALAQPFDTLKTRIQASAPGQFSGYRSVLRFTLGVGVAGLYKGFLPAWIRLGTQTTIIFVIFEQLRIRFGRRKFED